MLTALSGLTTRGRSFLASGLASIACSYFVVGAALLRIGVLLAAVPLVAAFLVSRTRYRVACLRSVQPGRISAGQEARVRLELHNAARLPTGILLVEDRVPYVLGSRPRFVLDRVEPRGTRAVAYRIRSDVRGRFPLGPISLRLADPFGMCEIDRPYTAQSQLVVAPVVHPLPPIRLAGDWSGHGDGHGSTSTPGEDDVAVREYHHGDDVRRVHWRASAHRGELMVRREEQPPRRHCTVVLDTRAAGHAGEGPTSSFEWSVSAAASIALHLARQGYSVGLRADDGSDLLLRGTPRNGPEFETAVLDGLAVVTPVGSGAAPTRWGADGGGRSGPGGLIIAIVGDLSQTDALALAQSRRKNAPAMAFVLDLAAWRAGGSAASRPEGASGTAGTLRERRSATEAVLRNAGWHVVTAAPALRLAHLWAAAGQAGAGGATAPAPAPANGAGTNGAGTAHAPGRAGQPTTAARPQATAPPGFAGKGKA